jgi:hypothetical protein
MAALFGELNGEGVFEFFHADFEVPDFTVLLGCVFGCR